MIVLVGILAALGPSLGKWGIGALVAVALVALIALFRCLNRRGRGKLDAATVALLSAPPPVEAACQPVVDALLSAPFTDDPAKCAANMRKLVAGGHLKYKSLQTDPEVLLRTNRHLMGVNSALSTRFTVQYNLFAGTIVALGSDAQRTALYESQDQGELGCFAFTEKGAGVLSGAAVETVASYDEARDEFVISSPTESSHKYWISQGLFAEHAVILANVIIAGENKGPHLFVHRIATRGRVGGLRRAAGVIVSSLPEKTSMLGLDNAYIEFDDFRVPRTALLSRFVTIEKGGAHSFQLPKGVKRMLDLLISRLLTGRICLSDYAVAYASECARRSYDYASKRQLWQGRKKQAPLMADMPLIAGVFRDYGRSLAVVSNFIAVTRARVAECIRNDAFTNDVVEAACICKFVGTSFGVDAVSALRKVMTAQGLLDPFLGTASFACNAACAAEGDNTVMELKVVGDMVRGRTPMLPKALLLRSLLHWESRPLVFVMLKGLARAMWLRRAALKEGQLLRDIAWSRALMLIMDTWRKTPGKDPRWLDSFKRLMARFPVPHCH